MSKTHHWVRRLALFAIVLVVMLALLGATAGIVLADDGSPGVMQDNPYAGMGAFAFIGSIVIPMVVALVTRPSTPSWAKYLASFLLCIVVGAIVVWQTTGSWEWSVPFVMSIFGAAVAFYEAVIKPSGLGKWLASKWVKDPKTITTAKTGVKATKPHAGK